MIIGKRIITAGTELRLRAAGDWPPRQVRVVHVPSSWQAGPQVRQLIESEWAAAVARPGVVLYDGPTCRLESVSADSSGLTLRLSEISYKTFVATNLMHPELADAYGPEVLANSMGVGVPVRSCDGFIIMGRRNQTVAWYPGRAHPFAGGMEPDDGGDPFAAGRRELREEAAVEESDLLSLRCIGLLEDVSIRQPELILRADIRLDRARIESNVAREEHHDIFALAVTPENVAAAVNDRVLTPAGVGALLLWGRSEWGDDWLKETVKNHCAVG